MHSNRNATVLYNIHYNIWHNGILNHPRLRGNSYNIPYQRIYNPMPLFHHRLMVDKLWARALS